jgi:hypothetical protein
MLPPSKVQAHERLRITHTSRNAVDQGYGTIHRKPPGHSGKTRTSKDDGLGAIFSDASGDQVGKRLKDGVRRSRNVAAAHRERTYRSDAHAVS